MITVLIYFLLAYGICNTIIYANGPFYVFKRLHEILEPIHPQLNELISCFICLPYWFGFFASTLNILLFPLIPLTPMNIIFGSKSLWYVIIFFDGAITSGGCWLIHTFQEMMERIGSDG